ncbi:hypothetical protein [Rathayibacter sp. Leaf299]|uniref:hypothetical protein n=1 Tax=Rathayibacter sp. Leaf299 TaxID=1736328 RepID=UPI000B1AA470|nr:hypothetical protein [Rathayibacter sp. Leaf299]
MTRDGELDAPQLRALFQELSDRLEERGQQARFDVWAAIIRRALTHTEEHRRGLSW